MQVETSGSFGGLGIEITLRDDILTVVAPIEGTPAYRAGIQPGDRIVKIEGISTKDMQLTDAVKRMRGKPGTKIVISIVREGWTEPQGFRHHPRADPRAVGEDAGARVRHRVHPPPPVPGADRAGPGDRARQVLQGREDPGPRPRPAQQPRRAAHLGRRGVARSSSTPASSSSTPRAACATRTCASRPTPGACTRTSPSWCS